MRQFTTWLALLALSACDACTPDGPFDFKPTPPPHASIKGRLDGLPDGLRGKLGGNALSARAVAADGRVLASANVKAGEEFTLNLEPSIGDQYNVRILIGGGSVQVGTLASQVIDGRRSTTTAVGDVGQRSTAAELLLEAYSATARSGLAGTPPSVTSRVMANASNTDNADVAAFHALVQSILDAMDPSRGATGFADSDGEPSDEILTAAGIERAQYEAVRDRAVDVVGVPVVCDPSRIRVLFTADISGQALDGNGKKQFIRQLPKEGRVFLGITLDASSPVADAARSLKTRLTPNDPDTEMFDDGTHGDEVAADQVFSTTVDLPRGMRVIYKFTDGSPGEGYTGTEEWPGNARILEVVDTLTGNPDGMPDCLLVRRDSFGDESSNKNFVNLHSVLAGGALQFDTDLGGALITAAPSSELLPVGGLTVGQLATLGPLTPAGIPESRENGVCTICPPPITVPVDDSVAPTIINARFSATDQVQILFSEDLDLGTAAQKANYLITDENNTVVPIRKVEVTGALVVLSTDTVNPTRTYELRVRDVADASLDRNTVAADTRVIIGKDTVAPTLLAADCSTITEVNPAARPSDARQGEVVVVHFSEVLDRISSENTAGYSIEGPTGAMPVYAAFQRGRDVLLVTDSLTGGAEYTVRSNLVFDVAGNIIHSGASAAFVGLRLFKVQLNAVPGHAWRSVDGRERGLPAGSGLYITGTITQSARALDGADLRVNGRPDVAGRDGYALSPTSEMLSGQPIYRAELMLPVGTYSFKLAHGNTSDAANPPATLETVTKSLSTTNDATGVQVDPISLVGADGLSYAGARLSLTGDDAPGQGVLFKRENPDTIVNVASADVELPVLVIGTWRDSPFGRGQDYDDSLREMTLPVAGATDTAGPVPISAEARDSESILLSFDEALSTQPADLVATVTDEDGIPLSAAVLAVGIPRPNQAVLRTGPMALSTGYTVLVTRAADPAGHTSTEMRTVAFTSPGAFTPFTPVVDSDPPRVVVVLPDSPTSMLVRFSERVAQTATAITHYTITLQAGGAGPAVTAARLVEAGRAALLTTEPQTIRAAYSLTVTNVDDLANPPNRLMTQSVNFDGFGDTDAPTLEWARAVSPSLVLLKFNEPVDASSAASVPNYVISGINVVKATPSNSADVAGSAFNEAWAPVRRDLVVLQTDPMQGGRMYTVTATSVLDRTGNASSTIATFMSVTEAPRVTVEIRYLISNTALVVGVGSGGAPGAPARALSPMRLSTEREGVFIIGSALTEDGSSPITDNAITTALGGFPAEGSPLEGTEPQLRDDGMGGDAMANDRVYTLTIPNVPLGSVISYKAFASYSTTYRDQNPNDPLASFADAPAGPFTFGDGQEYPGNDNAAWLLADENGDGKVILDNLFGDEVSFKRKTGFRPFAWVTDLWRRQE